MNEKEDSLHCPFRRSCFGGFAAAPPLVQLGDYGIHFPIWIVHTARHGHRAVMGQYIAIQGIERGIVDVRSEDAFLQVVQVLWPIALCGRSSSEPR